MRRIAAIFFLLPVLGFSLHDVPPEDYGPPYFYPVNPDERLYKIPLAAGESTYISDSYETDPKPGVPPDPGYTIDFDTRYGQMVYAARAGRVYLSSLSGGVPDWYTVEIGRVDSIPDSTSVRPSGWRLIQSLDMYRHLLEGTVMVKIGDDVVQGQPIARTNNVGNAPHLHFQVMISYLNVSRKMVPTAFWDIRVQPQGFPERFETYVSGNEPIRVELPGNAACGRPLSLFPNPFGSSVAVRFTLRERSAVSLEIYEVTGRLTETLLPGSLMNPGNYSLAWSPDGLPSGVYLCRFAAGGKVFSRPLFRRR